MFNNIGRKIKGLARVIFWITLVLWALASLGGMIAMIATVGRYNGGMVVLAIFAFFVSVGIGFLVSWIGSFFMFGYGQLIDDTEINRKTNQQILLKLNGNGGDAFVPKAEAPFVPQAQPYAPAADFVPEAPAAEPMKVQYCKDCGAKNEGEGAFCYRCGARLD